MKLILYSQWGKLGVTKHSLCSYFLRNFLCKGCILYFFFFAKLSVVSIRISTHPHHMTLVIKTAESLAFKTVITVIIRNERTLCSLTELQWIYPEKDLSVSKKCQLQPTLTFRNQKFFPSAGRKSKNFPNNTPDSTGGWFPASELDWR